MGLLRKYFKMIREDVRIAMSYRCGLDELNNFIMLVGFLFIVISLFSRLWIFTLLGAVFVVLCYMRVFSKKLEQRRKENDMYMRYMGRFALWLKKVKRLLRMKLKTLQDKEYAYFVCRQCGQIIRVPKGKNKISVRCPKCSATFVGRT